MSFVSTVLPASSTVSQILGAAKTAATNAISGKLGMTAQTTAGSSTPATPTALTSQTATPPAAAPSSTTTNNGLGALPSSTAVASNISNAQQSLAGDQTTFLKLLTAQLQNQDPLSPLDPTQFTQQLVQMSGVQQQILSNQLLQSLVQSQGNVGSSVGLIGKTVTAGSSGATIQDGSASWSYSLDSNAADVSMQVVDNLGNVIWQGDAGAVGAGQHTFPWDGTNLQGQQLPNGGTYGLVITAKDAQGAAVSSQVFLQGQATAITSVGGTTYVTINGTKVPLTAVTSVQATT